MFEKTSKSFFQKKLPYSFQHIAYIFFSLLYSAITLVVLPYNLRNHATWTGLNFRSKLFIITSKYLTYYLLLSSYQEYLCCHNSFPIYSFSPVMFTKPCRFHTVPAFLL